MEQSGSDDDDQGEEDAKEKPLLDKKEEAIKDSQEFKSWLKHAKGFAVLMNLILKFCESAVQDDDDDFESQSDEPGSDEPVSESALDIWPFLKHLVPTIVKATKAMTLYANVPFTAQETLDTINERAFRCLTALMWAKPDEFLSNQETADLIVPLVHNLIEQNGLRLTDSLLIESGLETLHKFANINPGVRSSFFKQTAVMTSEMLNIQVEVDLPASFLHMMGEMKHLNGTQCQHYFLRCTAVIFTSSSNATEFKTIRPNLLDPVLQFLLKTCGSGDIHLISLALDAFYEVFNENYFDLQLRNSGAIDQMEAGFAQLEKLYKEHKKQFSGTELAEIENALANVEAFVQYKKTEFNQL